MIYKNLITFKSDNRIRWHNFTIVKRETNKQIFTNYFSNRVVNNWNKLPPEIVNADSINSFKNLFDKHIGLRKIGEELILMDPETL